MGKFQFTDYIHNTNKRDSRNNKVFFFLYKKKWNKTKFWISVYNIQNITSSAPKITTLRTTSTPIPHLHKSLTTTYGNDRNQWKGKKHLGNPQYPRKNGKRDAAIGFVFSFQFSNISQILKKNTELLKCNENHNMKDFRN